MTTRDRIVIMVVAAIAVLGGFYFLALKPKREKVVAADAQIISAQQRLSQADAVLSTAKGAKEKYRTSYGTLANLGKAVPADDEIPSLIYQLQAVAKRNKVQFLDFQVKAGGGAAPSGASPASAGTTAVLPPGAAVGAAGFPTMPFSFVFNGSYYKLKSFLEDINDLTSIRSKGGIRVRGRLLQVDGIGMEAAESGFPHVKAKISATAYLLPEDQGLTAGGTPSSPTGSAPTPTADTFSESPSR